MNGSPQKLNRHSVFPSLSWSEMMVETPPEMVDQWVPLILPCPEHIFILGTMSLSHNSLSPWSRTNCIDVTWGFSIAGFRNASKTACGLNIKGHT